MKKGNSFIKVLKIENKKGLYTIDDSKYNSIIDISKDDIYTILQLIYDDNDCTLDEYQ